MRTDYIDKVELGHLLAALTPQNRLALEISLETGLRIGDVLNIRTEQLRGAKQNRFGVRELKTGKRRSIRLPVELMERALSEAGKVFVFENRLDWRKARTRQAVHKDLKRVAKMFRIRENVAPHSARKVFAVEQLRRTGDLARVQKLLNHESEAVTALYAMADQLTRRKHPRPLKTP